MIINIFLYDYASLHSDFSRQINTE